MENYENPMYVRIGSHTSFRKEILKYALDATEMLRKFEHLKVLRERNNKKLQELNGLLFDIKKTQRNLKKDMPVLPEEKERVEEKEQVIKKVEKTPKVETPRIEKPVSKEEDQLTRELMEIQKKLRSL